MVDGNAFGLVLELEDGSISWFFENELYEIIFKVFFFIIKNKSGVNIAVAL